MTTSARKSGYGGLSWGAIGAFVGMLRETLRAELHPTDAEAPLTLAKLKLIQSNVQRGMKTMPLMAIICALVHTAWAPLEATLAWGIIFIVFWHQRMRLGRVLPADTSDLNAVRKAARIYFVFSSAFLLAWASQIALFWQSGNPVNGLAITLIMVTSAGSASLTAAWLPAAGMQVLAYMGSVAVLLLMSGNTTQTLLGIAIAIYALFVTVGLSGLHAAAGRMLILEDQKDILIAELRASNHAKSEFLANMSHELRTPLNAIIGFSEVMKEEMFGPLGSNKYRDYANDIHGSGAHLLSLINDILDYAKIEAGRFVPAENVVVVDAIAGDALRFIQMRADDAGIKVKLAIEGNPTLRGDDRALKQCVMNLLSNAMKFTPRGGTITLGSRRTALGATLVWVADTGCGISADDQVKLFQNFGQGRHDIAVKERGTGLGLAITKGIVEAHGGTIGLDSALGRGTTFTISLPASRALKAVAKAA